ncbi:iron-sulfur cluster assembly scaffold protein [Candidatus Nomurabacteria bacterium]|uniref:Iron-sulfur cluster assembly scaffold protein n=1 Tax=Candidatus Dojkabacteria bacterium TaxID=2099670 RepID=A0A955I3F6_9BACT|nr:iron-sulfur cluster assembly scaffold protein [Candidatus Dojkabacteria bacterium]MCB9789659.1 iron-sulfur cluster assembly scaffold protein [Candidatus Nomurabacteria bacterium]MCB9804000.1 iron-sulfur cluster assembly scaffold protein [Candidatus Nomurabacteria bacterium]
MNTTSLYKEHVIDHYKDPRNWGRMDNYTHYAKVENSSCGDEMELFIEVNDGVVKDIRYLGRGCAISIATMSMFSEILKGKQLDDIKKLSEEDVLSLVGMNSDSGRKKCALLSLSALEKALESKEI